MNVCSRCTSCIWIANSGWPFFVGHLSMDKGALALNDINLTNGYEVNICTHILWCPHLDITQCHDVHTKAHYANHRCCTTYDDVHTHWHVHHMCYASSVAVVLVIVVALLWWYVCCAAWWMMMMLVVYGLDDKMCCDGDVVVAHILQIVSAECWGRQHPWEQ